MKKYQKTVWTVLFAVGVGCLSHPAFSQGFHIFGYGAAGVDFSSGLYVEDGGIDDGWGVHVYQMNVSFAGLMAKKVYAHVELESEGGVLGGGEQAWIAWKFAKNQRVIVGKHISNFGAFSQYYHVPWVHKLQEPPLGLQKVAPMPLVDIGVVWTGVLPIGKNALYYDLFVNEGWEKDTTADFSEWGERGPNIGGEKVFGGRVGMFFPMGLEVRASAMMGQDVAAQAIDFYFRKKAFLMRAEYDMYKVSGKNRSGYFVELGYRTRKNIEPVLVFSGYSIEPTAGNVTMEKGTEIGVGMNYYLSAASVLRLTVKQASKVETMNGQDTKSNGLHGSLTLVSRF